MRITKAQRVALTHAVEATRDARRRRPKRGGWFRFWPIGTQIGVLVRLCKAGLLEARRIKANGARGSAFEFRATAAGVARLAAGRDAAGGEVERG